MKQLQNIILGFGIMVTCQQFYAPRIQKIQEHLNKTAGCNQESKSAAAIEELFLLSVDAQDCFEWEADQTVTINNQQ